MHGILEAELLPAAYKTKTHIDREKPSKNNRDEYRAPFFGKMTGILFPMALFTQVCGLRALTEADVQGIDHLACTSFAQ